MDNSTEPDRMLCWPLDVSQSPGDRLLGTPHPSPVSYLIFWCCAYFILLAPCPTDLSALALKLCFFLFRFPPHPETWPSSPQHGWGCHRQGVTRQKAWIRRKGVDLRLGQFEPEVLVGNPAGNASRQCVLDQGRDNDCRYGFETHHKIIAHVSTHPLASAPARLSLLL